MVAIAVLIFSGCFSKILMIILYNKMLEDSFHISDCNSELMKQIKLRYTNQIKLELPIQDAEKFVSRYIYQYSRLIKFINVLDMLSLIVMLSGIALNYERKYFGSEVLFIAMFIYMSTGLLVDGQKKEKIIINNIADYLVNNLSTRMTAKEHRMQVKEELLAEVKPEQKIDDSSVKVTNYNIKDLDNSIIEEVLREFFI